MSEANVQPGSLADRYLGTLLGLACGDALGGPLEFLDRQRIARDFPNGVSAFVGGGWLDLQPGEVTDDTQQTLILARSLTEDGLDLGRFAMGLLAWFHSNPKDIGTTTRVALASLAAGTPPLRAGAEALAARGNDAAAANGALMRCAPVALRFRTAPASLIQASLDSARVTHAEARAAWATVAVNQAIVHLLHCGPVAAAPEAAVAGITNAEIRQTVLGAGRLPRNGVRANGFVLHTLGAAFWALANGQDSREVIVAAVELGEDADTTGAVAGALSGAAYGASTLPGEWRENVQFRDDLQAEALRLLRLSQEDAAR